MAQATPLAVSGDVRGFDFTGHVRRLCADMVQRTEELKHIQLDRVAICFAQTRAAGPYGIQASLTPMRFEAGATTGIRRGRRYKVQQVLDERGREYLYILTFYLPRFLNHAWDEKVKTIVHELWHISPAFDGDLRRFAGRCYAHGPSQKKYDAEVEQVAARWRAGNPPPELFAFLQHDFRSLQRRYGTVYGVKIRTPKLIPLAD